MHCRRFSYAGCRCKLGELKDERILHAGDMASFAEWRQQKRREKKNVAAPFVRYADDGGASPETFS